MGAEIGEKESIKPTITTARTDSGSSWAQLPTVGGILTTPEYRSAFLGAVFALTLAVFGGAVLPLPWAFSITGAGCGLLALLLGSLANGFTSALLIRQLCACRASSYESLALAVGGKTWMVVTQVSILMVLAGTVVSVLPQMGEAGAFALDQWLGKAAPDWLVGHNGATITIVLALGLALPLCAIESMRELEHVGMIGFLVPVGMTIIVIIKSIKHGLPALRSGDFAIFGFRNSLGNVSQAMSVVMYGAFIQPMMMPLYAEMPGTPAVRAKILLMATHWVIFVHAMGLYGLLGFFGAAWLGSTTRGNILQNKIFGGGMAQGMLNLSVAAYLATSVPPCELPCRHVLDHWLPGDRKIRPVLRHVLLSSTLIVLSLLVGIIWGAESQTILVCTGATAVYMCSYAIPVINHFLLYFNSALCQQQQVAKEGAAGEGAVTGEETTGPVTDTDRDSRRSVPGAEDEEASLLGHAQAAEPLEEYRISYGEGTGGLISEYVWEILFPVLILVLGGTSSAMSLWVALR